MVTFERLFQLLFAAKDHSGFLFFEEGQQFFETLYNYKKGNSDRIRALQLKGGSQWTRELVGDQEERSCPFTHVPITGYTQPEPLMREVSKTPNDGLLNRWTTVFPEPVFPAFEDLDISADFNLVAEDDEKVQTWFFRIWQLTHDTFGGVVRREWILCGRAKEVYAEGFNNIQAVLRKLYDKNQLHKAGLIAKTKGEALQTAAIFHVLELVSDPTYPENLVFPDAVLEVSEDSVRYAWNYVNLTTKQRVYFENDSAVTKVCSEVLKWDLPGTKDDDADDSDSEASDDDGSRYLGVMDKQLRRVFLDFREETIGRTEVGKTRKFGNVPDIDELFAYASSAENDG
ncbi:hypothetical protein KFL_000580370 [Klebsormidium nitens]|uniref:Uncharacterized protein n=1 Tax=Klebsormidium nitens TaxID=105231 RepID=A0A1Y1HS50_KLENI|nr:hypothetical protein KFL_000580370 [Klebsormidium nitens]|eukprot:GAQ80642.1 hypothetical protein KFL_000580370 [Klebsormidium nitens]